MTLLPDQLLARLAATYESVASEARLHWLEGIVIRVSLLGLGLHLLLVALSRWGLVSSGLATAVGTSFLSALYTPFSFVLFYEVLLLVLALPSSMTVSLGKQFEIVSLILLRSVFKDIAEVEELALLSEEQGALTAIVWDMGGGIGMFLLLGVYYHVSQRNPRRTTGVRAVELPAPVSTFVLHKQALAILLASLLVVLAVAHLAGWLIDCHAVVLQGMPSTLEVDQIFYLDLFTVMVFVDVIVLLLSMELDSAYPMVFRNAGYVVATLLLRFSLSLGKPWDVAVALLAVVFGVAVAGIHRYWRWLERPSAALPNVKA